jgi:hypothetical protein
MLIFNWQDEFLLLYSHIIELAATTVKVFPQLFPQLRNEKARLANTIATGLMYQWSV